MRTSILLLGLCFSFHAGAGMPGEAGSASAGKFDPRKCSYPRNLFTGPDQEQQLKNYRRTQKEVEACRGGIAYVYPVGDGNNWAVTCDRTVKGEYVMTIPEGIRNSNKQYTVYNRTGKGWAFGLDALPGAAKGPAAETAYFKKVCNDRATVNFELGNDGCLTFSFKDPSEYGSKLNPKAFLIGQAAEDCDKIAKGTDVDESLVRLIEKRKAYGVLQGCLGTR